MMRWASLAFMRGKNIISISKFDTWFTRECLRKNESRPLVVLFDENFEGESLSFPLIMKRMRRETTVDMIHTTETIETRSLSVVFAEHELGLKTVRD
jgi:hypothetical protein